MFVNFSPPIFSSLLISSSLFHSPLSYSLVFYSLLFSSILFSLVSSPHSENQGEVLSTSTESGSVIIDVVRQTNLPDGLGGVAFHDTGREIVNADAKLIARAHKMKVYEGRCYQRMKSCVKNHERCRD